MKLFVDLMEEFKKTIKFEYENEVHWHTIIYSAYIKDNCEFFLYEKLLTLMDMLGTGKVNSEIAITPDRKIKYFETVLIPFEFVKEYPVSTFIRVYSVLQDSLRNLHYQI